MSPNRRRAWIDHHWRALMLAVAGVLLGGIIGWWAGSATACVNCEANAVGIEALGTWVGGLGTVAAVGFAVIAFRSEEQSRRDLERQLLTTRREQSEFDRKEAEQVTIEFMVGSTYGGNQATELRVLVKNGTSTSEIYKLRGAHDSFGPMDFQHALAPGKTYAHRWQFGPLNPQEPIPYQLPPSGELPAWSHGEADKTEVSFELRGHEWLRRGSRPVQLRE